MVNKNGKILIIGILIGSAFLMLKGCQLKEQKLGAIDRSVNSLKATEDILKKNGMDESKEGLIGNKDSGITYSNALEEVEISKEVVENDDIKPKVSKELETTSTPMEEKIIKEVAVDEKVLAESKEKDKEEVKEPLEEKKGIKGLIFGMFNFNNFHSKYDKRSAKRLELPGESEEPELPGEPELPEEPPIIIWEDGEDIEGLSYTLTEDITAEGADGLRTTGGEIINKATITAEENYYGMRVESGRGVNKGLIKGQGGGMYASDEGKIINDADGTIENGGDYGMKVVGTGSDAINKGRISNTGDYGMEGSEGGNITNEVGGTIENDGDYGMKIVGFDSEAINRGTISNTGDYGMEGSEGGNITNEVGGTIENGGDYGMKVAGFGSEAINK